MYNLECWLLQEETITGASSIGTIDFLALLCKSLTLARSSRVFDLFINDKDEPRLTKAITESKTRT